MSIISPVKSHQINAITSKPITSEKTVHMKDVSTIKAALNNVRNSIDDFCKDLDKPGIFKPGKESFNRLQVALKGLSDGANKLLSKIDSSSYQHHASKRANLEKISVKVDLLNKEMSNKFNGSQRNAQFMREVEDRYRANQTERAKANFARKQHAKEMIKAGRGDELFNGGMVK